jgi:hypothetical protein
MLTYDLVAIGRSGCDTAFDRNDGDHSPRLSRPAEFVEP